MNCNPLCLILLLSVLFGGNDCGCGCNGYNCSGAYETSGQSSSPFGRMCGSNNIFGGNYCEMLILLLFVSWIFGGNGCGCGCGGGFGDNCGCGC